MNRDVFKIAISALLIVCITGAVVNSTARRADHRFLDLLNFEQTVVLKDVPGGFEIIITKELPTLQRVVAVGDDYLTVEDPNGFAAVTIPVYQIRCIRKYNLR